MLPLCGQQKEAIEGTRNVQLHAAVEKSNVDTSGRRKEKITRMPAATICIARGARHDLVLWRRPVAIVIPVHNIEPLRKGIWVYWIETCVGGGLTCIIKC